MLRTFLVGNLCGVIMAATVAVVFAIPANTFHWRMEIWKRGGGAWAFDKNGKISWIWTVKPLPDAPQKRVIVPSRERTPSLERL
jgi:hypothetical protein